MDNMKLVDKYFITNKLGMFLDTSFQFTLNAPYDEHVYSADSRAAAQAVISGHHLTQASVLVVPRFIPE